MLAARETHMHSIEDAFLRMYLRYTSSAKVEPEIRIWLSMVESVAAKMAQSTKPASSGGNNVLAMITKRSSGVSKPWWKNEMPTKPMAAAAESTIICQVKPTHFALAIFLGSSMPIKFIKICGWPK